MSITLVTLALVSGLAAALPAPAPAPQVTEPAVTTSSTPTSATPEAVGCTITSDPPSEFTQLIYEGDSSYISTISIPGGPGCNCENGVIAGIITTTANDGQETLYCATGLPTTTADAQSTVVPEPTPGSADNEGWAQVTCDQGAWTDPAGTPEQSWNDAGSAAAYRDWKAAWDDLPEQTRENCCGNSFNNYVEFYFKTKPAPQCELLDSVKCQDTIQCGQSFAANAPSTSPAGYVIFNSMVGVHTLFEDIYAGLNTALTNALGEVGQFVTALSPINEDIANQIREKKALDAAQAAVFGLLAPTLHSGFGRTKFAKNNPNWISAGFDTTYGLVGSAFALAKDSLPQLSPLTAQNTLSATMVETTKGYVAAINATNSGIMGTPDELFTWIDQGKFFPGDNELDPVAATDFLQKGLLAATLSTVWVTGDPNEHAPPVIVTGDGVPGTGCEGRFPRDYVYPEQVGTNNAGATLNFGVGDDVLLPAFACVDGNPYWLMGAKVDKKEACLDPFTSAPQECVVEGIEFQGLYGIEKLGDFGLSKESVIGNAVNSWTANGNKNGWSPLELASNTVPEEAEALITQDIGRTKGLVNIPVCTFTDIVRYLNENPDTLGEDNPNHPCPP